MQDGGGIVGFKPNMKVKAFEHCQVNKRDLTKESSQTWKNTRPIKCYPGNDAFQDQRQWYF